MRACWVVMWAAACFGCGTMEPEPPESAADACRDRASFARFGRILADRSSPTADAVEQLRCDEIAREDRAEARERHREREERKARAIADDERVAAIRRSPQAPELGAGMQEARIVCSRQRGRIEEQTGGGWCTVVGGNIFGFAVDDEGAITRVAVYIEDADLAATRAMLSAKLGDGQERRLGDGKREIAWETPAEVVSITMYSRGVRVVRVARAGAAGTSEIP